MDDNTHMHTHAELQCCSHYKRLRGAPLLLFSPKQMFCKFKMSVVPHLFLPLLKHSLNWLAVLTSVLSGAEVGRVSGLIISVMAQGKNTQRKGGKKQRMRRNV